MPRSVRYVVALALLAHLLMVLAMAASPQLHEAIHHDADDDDHECAVTLFHHGAMDDATPPPVLVTMDLPCVETVRMEVAQEVFLARAGGSIRGRAPPVAAV